MATQRRQSRKKKRGTSANANQTGGLSSPPTQLEPTPEHTGEEKPVVNPDIVPPLPSGKGRRAA